MEIISIQGIMTGDQKICLSGKGEVDEYEKKGKELCEVLGSNLCWPVVDSLAEGLVGEQGKHLYVIKRILEGEYRCDRFVSCILARQAWRVVKYASIKRTFLEHSCVCQLYPVDWEEGTVRRIMGTLDMVGVSSWRIEEGAFVFEV